MDFAKKNLTLLFLLLIAVLIMGIGYAAIESITGEIDVKAIANAQNGMFITDATYVSDIDANTENSKIDTYSGMTLKSTIELSNANVLSSITYKVSVYNNSKDIAKFTEVKYDSEFYDNDAITFEITGFAPGERIKSKETKDVFITFKYKDTSAIPTNRTLNSYLNFNMETMDVTTADTYLPTGFTQVEGTNLETGLTIQDSNGNQYVWVEVPQTKTVYPTAGLDIKKFTTEEYTAIETDLHTYTDEYRDNIGTDEYYSDGTKGLTSEQYYNLKRKMLKSIYQNGGFYVGKYETGIEDAPKIEGSETVEPTEIPVIKKNVYPYNYVTCSQAQTLANNIESGDYTSSLMFGVQWDLVLKYLETKGTKQADLKNDSTKWGNYSNNLWNITNENSKYTIPDVTNWTSGAYGTKDSNSIILLSTGASEIFCKQGIYDFAGNLYEWTLEYNSYESNICPSRGGSYYHDGDSVSAVTRSYNYTNIYGNDIGFRVTLY